VPTNRRPRCARQATSTFCTATGRPASVAYFTGTVEWVQLDIAEAAEDLDHLITPEERLEIAMTRQ
jgi:hypothetical protein